MMAKRDRYDGWAITLHWLSAALIGAGFALGLWMVGLPFGPTKLRSFAWHKWLGLTVLLLTLLRLLWRGTRGVPAPVPGPAWQVAAAAWTHRLFYLLLVAIPLSGWLYSSASGVGIVWFGVVALPDLVAKDRALAAGLRTVHAGLNYTLAGVVFVHVGAALRHHFVHRDAVLARMLPRRRRSPRGHEA